MLNDFLEINNLDAKIIPTSTNASIGKAINSGLIPRHLAVEVKLFNSKKNEPLIIIIPYDSKLNPSVIKDLLGEDVIEMDEKESVEITGYKKNFIPPISIYRIKIVLDLSLKNKKYLFCKVNEKAFLKVSLKEIIQINDDVSFVNLID